MIGIDCAAGGGKQILRKIDYLGSHVQELRYRVCSATFLSVGTRKIVTHPNGENLLLDCRAP